MDNQYMDMFLDESHEHLQSLNEGLLRLEENMEEISVVNDIFRNAHTLKGMSATMGFAKIAELTHEMEDVLDLVRKEELKLNEDIIDRSSSVLTHWSRWWTASATVRRRMSSMSPTSSLSSAPSPRERLLQLQLLPLAELQLPLRRVMHLAERGAISALMTSTSMS